jgi:hypothetical protein
VSVDVKTLPGMVATVVLSGTVESAYAKCHEDMRAFNITNGITAVEYCQFQATLVEAGRDGAVEHFLNAKTREGTSYAWMLQIDADATFPPDSLVKILNTAFNLVPDSDVVGGYAQLKGTMIPSIDTGTGTWELHYPGEGVLEVMRTGAHFLLTKRSAFEKMGPAPWFRTRWSPRAIDSLAEVDNYARQKLSGRNPLSDTPEWQTLLTEAAKGSAGGPSSVGEDSGFCDRLKACGGNIYVDTGLVTGHVYKDIITPDKLIEKVKKRDRQLRLVCGILE